ncbi:MAG: ABC transporter permease, partial [Isosphaeraceae bacterium]
MKTPLAWCNLCQDKLRTLVATGGVAFALTLVFMELGFLGSVTNTASLVLDQFDFDIAIVARGYRNLIDAGTFPRLRLYEAQSVPGVARTTPLYVGVQGWRSERDRPEDHHFHLGKHRPILVLGFPAGNQPFRFEIDGRPFPIQVTHQDLARLRRVDTLLLDLQSHESFEPRQRGREVEVGGRKLRIEGLFSLGTGFASDGTILVSDETFRNLFDGYPLERVSLGLVRLTDNRTSAVESVKQRLRQILIREIPGRPLVGREDIGIL